MYSNIADPVFRFTTGFLLMLSVTNVSVSQQHQQQVEAMLAKICRQSKIPSLTVAATDSESTLVAACHGVRKKGDPGEVMLSDRHPIGSNTKSMTATLAGVMVEKGLVDWTTTIGDAWAKDNAVQVHSSLVDVTLDELLSHQSGVRADLNSVGDDWASFFEENDSPRNERKRMVQIVLEKKPAFKRGEFNYSNLGYVIAAAMLERRAGESYETLMQRELFKPLEMNSASFRTLKSVAKQKGPLVWGHGADGEPFNPKVAGAENPSVYAPCGTLNVSIEDYAKYARWHLGGKPSPVLKRQETFEHLHSGKIKAKGLGGDYGSGWIMVNSPFGRAMSHAGSNTHCFAVIWIYPEKDFAAIACTNSGQEAGYFACENAIRKLAERFVK